MSSPFTRFEKLAFDITSKIIGQPLQYTPVATGTPQTVQCLFENVYVEVNPGNGVGVQSLKPSVRLQLSDLVAPPAKNDSILVGLVTYKVEIIEQDRFGGVTLYLKKA